MDKALLSKKGLEIRERSEKNKGKEHRWLYKRISYAIVRDGHLRRTGARAFGIFIAIVVHAGKDNIAYPSLKTISFLSGCSVTTVQKEIKILIKEKWIEKIGRKIESDRKFGNMQYKILQRDLVRGSQEKGFIDQPVVEDTNGV